MAIRVLDPQLASMIAAGEVVERPASVVKELVENSLDAGATAVSIEIQGGGLSMVRVVDNGAGIPPEQAELAFRRFATSKIDSPESLGHITTLGFRGEALPSIASVSTVTLLTRTSDEAAGTLVEVSDGQTSHVASQGSPRGTSVTVRGLFSKVPARLKFLRSNMAEASRVQALVHRFALAFPEVRFSLETDGRASFASSGTGDLREACSAVYGPKTARSLLVVGVSTNPGEIAVEYGVYGLVSPPDSSRASRAYMHLLVNRRWVQSRSLAFALEEAYHGFLMEHRHPLAVLHLSVPPEEVDVNVHPAKLEVRFHQEREVFSTLQRAVRGALVAHSPVPTVRPGFGLGTPSVPPRNIGRTESQQALALLPPEPEVEEASGTPRQVVPSLRVLGQMQNLYIVAEGPQGMYLVDQHAAHERVLYEILRGQFRERRPQVQGLLEAAVVEMTPSQEEALESHAEQWASYGFHMEAFGSHSYLLRAVPAVIRDTDPGETLLAILEEVAQGGETASWEHDAASSIACHSSVRAGRSLALDEMESLLAQLEAAEQPNTCPHGRPTMVHISAANLEREFGRR